MGSRSSESVSYALFSAKTAEIKGRTDWTSTPGSDGGDSRRRCGMPAVCGREASPGPLGSLAPALPLRRDSRPDLIHSTSTAEHVLGAEPGSRNGDAAESNTGALPVSDAPCEGRMIKLGREGGRIQTPGTPLLRSDNGASLEMVQVTVVTSPR